MVKEKRRGTLWRFPGPESYGNVRVEGDPDIAVAAECRYNRRQHPARLRFF